MKDNFEDPNFWAVNQWQFRERDDRMYVVAKSRDGRWFTWKHPEGFVLFEDEFEAWVRETRENAKDNSSKI